MLDLSSFRFSHMCRSVLSPQSHTGDETSRRWLKKRVQDVLWMNWFFMYPNFHPGVNFCPSFNPPSCKYFSMCAFPPCLSTSQAFTSHPTFTHLHFSFLDLFLSLAFCLFTVTPLFFLQLWASVFLT